MQAKSTFIRSFGYAFEGIWAALKGRNFKIIVFAGVFAATAGLIFRLSTPEWIVLILTINIVITAELLNTAVEAIVDLVSPEIRDKAKIAKDVSVAGVLISSMFAVVLAAFIFLPKLFALLY